MQTWRSLEFASDRGRIALLDVQTTRIGGHVGIWGPSGTDCAILLRTSLGSSSSMEVISKVTSEGRKTRTRYDTCEFT